jgi:hypothetical protein
VPLSLSPIEGRVGCPADAETGSCKYVCYDDKLKIIFSISTIYLSIFQCRVLNTGCPLQKVMELLGRMLDTLTG